MEPPGDVTLEYTDTLHPLDKSKSDTFYKQIVDFAETIYTQRQEKVAVDDPLLSQSKPYYHQTQLDTNIAYSIDSRNIHKWMRYFLVETASPPQITDTITFDIPPKKYTQDENTISIELNETEVPFELSNDLSIDLSTVEPVLSLEFTISTQTLKMNFEETRTVPSPELKQSSLDFETIYDEYQSQRHGFDSDKHQPFAIYSPNVEYERVDKLSSQQCDSSIVIVTNDDWKVCVRSPEDDNYVVDVSIVELLNPISDEVVQYYEDFSYPTRYIHIPELQYLHTLPDEYLTDTEELKLRTLPYAVPFGKEDLLFEKIAHTRQFNDERVHPEVLQSLQYKQFFSISTVSL